MMKVLELFLFGLGRLKKIVMKFFGGKRGICILFSFFGGGRSKGFGKGSFKKSFSKSKIYDSLNEVVCGFEDIVSERISFFLFLFELFCEFFSFRSVYRVLEIGFRCKIFIVGVIEKVGVEKVYFVFKLKKGLKGFFSSIRRYRKSKVFRFE